MIQWAPKGSYRIPQLLEWLEFVLPIDGTRVCVVLDWYACHLSDSVKNFILSKGHWVMYLGGGVTPWIQVPDTHVHKPLSDHYKKEERADALAQRTMRPGKLPVCSKQAVYDRALAAWYKCDHVRAIEAFVEDGWTNALDGSEDHKLTKMITELYHEEKIPASRDLYLKDIKLGVKKGSHMYGGFLRETDGAI